MGGATHDNSRGRVLIVDDDTAALAGLQALLDDEHAVRAASSIVQARAILETDAFDVIICDYQMPGGSGLDVLRFAREKQREFIGLIWTGRVDLANARKDRDPAEEFRVVPKSQDPDSLAQTVRQSIALLRMRAQTSSLRGLP